MESDSRAGLHTSVCTSEMEVEGCVIYALGSMHTPSAGNSPVQGTTRSIKKRLLSLLTVGTNAGNLTPQKARLYKAAQLLLRSQAYSHKKLVTVRKRLRAAKKLRGQLRSSNFAALVNL